MRHFEKGVIEKIRTLKLDDYSPHCLATPMPKGDYINNKLSLKRIDLVYKSITYCFF